MIVVNQSEFIDKKRWMDTLDCIYIGVDIRDVILSEADFPVITFMGAKLTNCSFKGQGVMFDKVIDCDILNCKFTNINLKKSTILGVHFCNCQFFDIDAFDLDISNSIIFENCSFKNVKMLESYIEADFKNCEFEDVIFSALCSEILIKKETASFNIRIESNIIIRI